MELDYFYLYLCDYLREHSFEPAEISSRMVKDNAKRASQVFADFRKAGASLDSANEEALKELTAGIGLSRAEMAADILEEEFSDRIHISMPEVLEFWTSVLADNDSIWESFHKEGELGLNEELVEERKGILYVRIDQFLSTYGL